MTHKDQDPLHSYKVGWAAAAISIFYDLFAPENITDSFTTSQQSTVMLCHRMKSWGFGALVSSYAEQA